jgi:DNA-binding response OmpR family regulator
VNAVILVVDDELDIRKVVCDYLERANFRAISAGDGAAALSLFRSQRPDFVILDLNLPEVDGLDVARAIRRESDVPIIMLTARVEEADRLIGLELGADDYVTKPFSPRELVARVKTVLRRVEPRRDEKEILHLGELVMDIPRNKLLAGGRPVELTLSEFKILETLMRSPGRVFTRMQLLEVIHDNPYAPYERVVDTHIRNLRKKIEPDPTRPLYILTVFGVGYKFSDEV